MELLAPAGNFEKLRYALAYGADAVYAAGRDYGLRAHSGNFEKEELKSAVEYVHRFGKKIYITINIYAHNRDLTDLPEYLQYLASLQVDALIISDPAIFSFARQYAPELPIHISTQANVTSWSAVKFWQELGARRIILARELSLAEISEIRARVPGMELEMFVQGAMCMSYSGRCLLSAYLTGRSANQGDCSQPCRWEYNLQERTRPGEIFTVEEDRRGTYIFNSRDLNLISRLPEIKAAGVNSLKIEGRMKSLYYVANVTRTWREAITDVEKNIPVAEELKAELEKVSHRVYCEGFADGLDSLQTQHHESSAYIRNEQYLGVITAYEKGRLHVKVKAKFSLSEEIELIFPQREFDKKITVNEIFDEENKRISFTKPNTEITLAIEGKFPVFGIIRKKIR
ncbi:MAG: U32 family peptidase C-terminal domain-containing protein [Candidatus Cloacimonetes bacterium]|nr:U32 family peptidase C-terminal domain-containing protein [Candidatus Cloacimonadota bacterium]